MKGQAEELIYFVIVFVCVFLLFVFLNYELSVRGREVRKKTEERLVEETGMNILQNIFNLKMPISEKRYAEILIDSLLAGKAWKLKKDKAFYGLGIGTVNGSEVLSSFINNYFTNWELELVYSNVKQTYGRGIGNKEVYAFSVSIPVPEEKVGRLNFYIG